MNKSESKYFNTATKIDLALISLLKKKPFEYITVSEICKTAGVNRSTFYLHYENTGELFAEAAELIRKHPSLFTDFEITKGKMDDVFLSVTGKKLSGEADK